MVKKKEENLCSGIAIISSKDSGVTESLLFVCLFVVVFFGLGFFCCFFCVVLFFFFLGGGGGGQRGCPDRHLDGPRGRHRNDLLCTIKSNERVQWATE